MASPKHPDSSFVHTWNAYISHTKTNKLAHTELDHDEMWKNLLSSPKPFEVFFLDFFCTTVLYTSIPPSHQCLEMRRRRRKKICQTETCKNVFFPDHPSHPASPTCEISTSAFFSSHNIFFVLELIFPPPAPNLPHISWEYFPKKK